MSKLYLLIRSSLYLALLLLPFTSAHAAPQSLATTALEQGRIDQAISLLRSAISSNPGDALSHNLLCRAFYAEEQPDSAIPECEAAVAHAPASSDFALWLGRVYGMKADRSGPLTGFSMARRVRTMFEKAVELDPHNVQAMSDLGEFYVSAPSIVGGGYDKAERLAAQLQAVSVARGHRLRAQLAEKRGDPTGAEQQFKAQIDSERSPVSLVDLGMFYVRQKRYNDAVATLKSAAELDHEGDWSIVEAASGFIDMKREPQFAAQLLRRYMDSSARSDAAPVPRACLLLGRLLARSGDSDGARKQFQQALDLASGYAPARAELNKLPAS